MRAAHKPIFRRKRAELAQRFPPSSASGTFPDGVPLDRDARLAYFAPSAMTAERFLHWCLTYKRDHFSAAFGSHHKMIAEVLQFRGQTVEFLAPREYGKTTFLRAFSDYCLCYGTPYLLHIEHDSKPAKTITLSAAESVLHNALLRTDYGLSPGRLWKPNGGELIIHNTNPYALDDQSYLRAIGAREIARGTVTTKSERISIAIVNDIVAHYSEAVSPAWNNFLEHLIREDLSYAGGGRRDEDITIFFVTTIQATNDISDRLRKESSVLTYECPAVQGEQADVLKFVEFVAQDTPQIVAARDACQGTIETGFTGQNFGREQFAQYCREREDYQAWFAKLRSTWDVQFPMSRHAYDIYRTTPASWLQEKMHITSDSQYQRFRREWFQAYRPADFQHGPEFEYVMLVDWSGLPKEGNDPKALYCGAYHRGSDQLYTLGVWCDLADHEETIRQMYRLFWACFPWYPSDLMDVTVYMEDIVSAPGITESFLESERENQIRRAADPEQAAAYWISLPVVRYAAGVRGNKLVSIAAVRPMIEQRRLFYVEGDPMQELMLDQFVNFQGKHTHGPLALSQKIDICDMVGAAVHHLRREQEPGEEEIDDFAQYAAYRDPLFG